MELPDEEVLEIRDLIIKAHENYRRYLETHKYYDNFFGDQDLTNLTKKEGLLPLLVYCLILDKIYFPRGELTSTELLQEHMPDIVS